MLPPLAQRPDAQNPDFWVTVTLYHKTPTKWVTSELVNHLGASQEWNSQAESETRPMIFRSEAIV